MDRDILSFFGVMMSIAASGAAAYFFIRVAHAFGNRLERRGAPSVDVLAELDDLRARVQELEGDRAHVTELEERLDFAERVLARGADSPKLEAQS